MGSGSLFLRDYEAEMRKYTDAPDVFHKAAAYAVVGAMLCTHKYRMLLKGGVPARWMNMWVILVGDSGQTRKSTVISMADEVLRATDPDRHAPNDGSPEGFAKDLVKKGNEDAPAGLGSSSIFVFPEMLTFFQNTTKAYYAPVKAMLMDFYDVPATYHRKLSKEEFTVKQPRVSLLGGLALEHLPNVLTAEDWLGGFMSRAIVVHGVRERLMEDAGTPGVKIFERHADHLTQMLKAWRKTRMKARAAERKKGTDHTEFLFSYDKMAGKAARDLVSVESADQNVRLVLARSAVHLMRMSAIEQLDMDPTSPVITLPALTRAKVLFEHWQSTVPDLMDSCFSRTNKDFEGDRLPRRLFRYLLSYGDTGCNEQTAMQACALNSDAFNKAMVSLEQAGMMSTVESPDHVGQKLLIAVRKGQIAPEVHAYSEP